MARAVDARTRDTPMAGPRADAIDPASLEPDVRDILALRSRDRERVVEVLSREDGLTAGLRPARDPACWPGTRSPTTRMFALRKVAEERVGQLVDALIDPEPGLRRPAPSGARVLGLRVAARRRRSDARPRRSAVRRPVPVGAVAGARSSRRTRASRSTATRIFAVVLREVDGRPAGMGEPAAAATASTSATAVDARRVRPDARRRKPRARLHAAVAGAAARAAADRVSQPAHRRRAAAGHGARVSRRRAAAGDPPAAVALPRAPRRATRSARPREEVIAELLRSNHSIVLNLEELQRARRVACRFDRIVRAMAAAQDSSNHDSIRRRSRTSSESATRGLPDAARVRAGPAAGGRARPWAPGCGRTGW